MKKVALAGGDTGGPCGGTTLVGVTFKRRILYRSKGEPSLSGWGASGGSWSKANFRFKEGVPAHGQSIKVEIPNLGMGHSRNKTGAVPITMGPVVVVGRQKLKKKSGLWKGGPEQIACRLLQGIKSLWG